MLLLARLEECGVEAAAGEGMVVVAVMAAALWEALLFLLGCEAGARAAEVAFFNLGPRAGTGAAAFEVVVVVVVGISLLLLLMLFSVAQIACVVE